MKRWIILPSLAFLILVIAQLGTVQRAHAFSINNPTNNNDTNTTSPLCAANSPGSNSSYCTETNNGGSNKISGPGGIILTFADYISLAAGAVAIIMIIIGGFRFVISGGDSNQVSGAKNMIIFSLVGIVVIAMAQVIVRFVLGNL